MRIFSKIKNQLGRHQKPARAAFMTNTQWNDGTRMIVDTQRAVRSTVSYAARDPRHVQTEDLVEQVQVLARLVAELYRVADNAGALDEEALATITPRGWRVIK